MTSVELHAIWLMRILVASDYKPGDEIATGKVLKLAASAGLEGPRFDEAIKHSQSQDWIENGQRAGNITLTPVGNVFGKQ